MAFDESHQGESGGEPRFLDDPMRRVGDIYSAVDYLTTLHYVDAGRIRALGRRSLATIPGDGAPALRGSLFIALQSLPTGGSKRSVEHLVETSVVEDSGHPFADERGRHEFDPKGE